MKARYSIYLIIAFLALCGDAFAKVCSCDLSGSSAKKLMNQADVVFLGTALNHSEHPKGRHLGSESSRVSYVNFKVSRIWKGDQSETIEIGQVYGSDSCDGFSFTKGNQYLVFASKTTFSYMLFFSRESLGIKHCSGTVAASMAQRYLIELGIEP